MVRRTMVVYLLIDDYTPDGNSTVYGVYSTSEKAEEALARLEDAENNEYGSNLNENDTIQIESYNVY